VDKRFFTEFCRKVLREIGRNDSSSKAVFGAVGILSGQALLYRILPKILRDTMVRSSIGHRVCVDDDDVITQSNVGRFRESCIVTYICTCNVICMYFSTKTYD
jgi:hypothetical protein